MGNGLNTLTRVMFGSQMWIPTLGRMLPMATGLIATMAGHGYQTIPGDGRRFTTAVGFTTTAMAGYGSQAPNGPLHGLPGDNQATTTDGRRFRRSKATVLAGSPAIPIGVMCPHETSTL